MTRNQLAYYELVEKKRSNLANETISSNTLNETKRHNLAGESFNLAQLAESSRHNKATEGISLSSLAETTRHNLNTETAASTSNTIRREELDLAKQKEAQRIKESLRDFDETVRYHNISALTSRSVTSLLTSSGMDTILKKLGLFAGTTGFTLRNKIRNAATRIATYVTETGREIKDNFHVSKPGEVFSEIKGVTAEEFATALSKLVQQFPIIFEQQADLLHPYVKHPNDTLK